MAGVWDQCLALLRERVNENTMATWLAPIRCEDESQSRMALSVPNVFSLTWVKDNYLTLIRECVSEVTGTAREIELIVRQEPLADEIEAEEESGDIDPLPEDLGVTDEWALNHNLNPRYNFESFVVGSCNQFAHAASVSVAENLGGTFNPLFL